jgi:hypothetical protein
VSNDRPRRAVLSPEYGVLVDALKPGEDASRPPDGLRWEHLLELAWWHRLGPLLYRHLGVDGPAPPDVLEQLRQGYVANASRNLYFGATLERILDALDRAGIRAMPLKGAALIDTVYSDPALRPMADLDVLVPRSRLDEANSVLAALGYRYRTPIREINEPEWMQEHHRHDSPLVDPDGLVKVELHYHVVKGAPVERFDLDGFWERGRPMAPGSPHFRPSPDDLVLHACIHFTYDRMSTSIAALGQLADVAWILDREAIDWDRLIGNARSYGLDEPVFLALFAAHDLGLAVPAEPLERLRPADFDERVARRMIDLRVLRTRPAVPRRSLRAAVAPGREGLRTDWGADDGSRLSVARAYGRRAVKSIRLVRLVLKEPRTVVQDYRLNRQLRPHSGGLRE